MRTAASLRKEHPKIKFHFYSGDAIEISEKLDHGTLDFAVMLEPVDATKYEFLPLPDKTMWGVLMNHDNVLAGQQAVTREIFREIPLIVHQRSGLQQEIAGWAGTDPEDLNIAATYNVVHGSPIPFVRQKLGYFVTTRDLLDSNLDDSVCFRPLEPLLTSSCALVWKKNAIFGKAASVFRKKLEHEIIQKEEAKKEAGSQ